MMEFISIDFPRYHYISLNTLFPFESSEGKLYKNYRSTINHTYVHILGLWKTMKGFDNFTTNNGNVNLLDRANQKEPTILISKK